MPWGRFFQPAHVWFNFGLFTWVGSSSHQLGPVEDPTYYIWLLDISGPAQAARNNWGDLKEAEGPFFF